jgi:hypothetical protein
MKMAPSWFLWPVRACGRSRARHRRGDPRWCAGARGFLSFSEPERVARLSLSCAAAGSHSRTTVKRRRQGEIPVVHSRSFSWLGLGFVGLGFLFLWPDSKSVRTIFLDPIQSNPLLHFLFFPFY